MIRFGLILFLIAGDALAGSVVSTRALRSQTVLTAADLAVVNKTYPGVLTDLNKAIGMETRVNIYAGQPIHPADLGPAALVERNETVTMVYRSAALTIVAEGRVLNRAGHGETVRVMNVDSKSVVAGRVRGPGLVEVSR